MTIGLPLHPKPIFEIEGPTTCCDDTVGAEIGDTIETLR